MVVAADGPGGQPAPRPRRGLAVPRVDQDQLDLDDLKWVVLMVLFNQPGSEAAYAWMETQMFVDEPEPVH